MLMRLAVAMILAGSVGLLALWCTRRPRRFDRLADEAMTVTRPLPRRKAPTADALRTDARLREIEAELDAEYRRLADFYLL